MLEYLHPEIYQEKYQKYITKFQAAAISTCLHHRSLYWTILLQVALLNTKRGSYEQASIE